MSKFVIECPNCGRFAEAKTGFFARKKIDCACGHTINVRTEKLAGRECPHCGNVVVFDQSKGEKAKCPVCGGKVIQKKSKRGYTFFGCDNYPNCNFMTWDKPTDEVCPQCGKSLFKRKGGVLACLNEGCGFEKKAERKRKKKDETGVNDE